MYAAMSFSIVYLSMACLERRGEEVQVSERERERAEQRTAFFQSDSSHRKKEGQRCFTMAAFFGARERFSVNTVTSARLPSRPKNVIFDENDALWRAQATAKKRGARRHRLDVNVADFGPPWTNQQQRTVVAQSIASCWSSSAISTALMVALRSSIFWRRGRERKREDSSE